MKGLDVGPSISVLLSFCITKTNPPKHPKGRTPLHIIRISAFGNYDPDHKTSQKKEGEIGGTDGPIEKPRDRPGGLANPGGCVTYADRPTWEVMRAEMEGGP